MSFREECDDGYLNQTADLDLTLLEDDTDDDLVNDGLFGGSANNISRQVPNQAPPTMAGINRRFAGYTGDVRSRSMYCPTPSPRLPQRRVSSFPFSMPGEMQAGMMSSRGLSMSALPPSMMNANPRRAAFRAMLRDQHLREISSHKALRAQHRQYRNLVNSNAGLGFFRGGLPPEIDFTRGDARNRIRRHNKLVDSYASQLRAQFSLESNDSDQCRSGLSPSDEELEVSRLDSLGPFSDFANQEMPVDPDQLRSSSSLSSMQAMSRSHPSFSDPRYADGSVAVADIPLSRNFDRFPKSLSDAYNRADLDHQDDNFADGSNLYHSDCNPLNAIRSSDVFHDTVAKRSASSYALSASELSKLMEGCELISSEHQGMVSELVFVSIGQMMPCG